MFVSIPYILALVAIEDMEIHKMDVKIAIINGDLERRSTWNNSKDSHMEGNIQVEMHNSKKFLPHTFTFKHY
jgi:hypothetical protein